MSTDPFITAKKKAKMLEGAQLYLNWFSDILNQGLQYLEQQPALLESIAEQMVDTGNSSMARQIRIVAAELSDLSPEEWIGILADQAIIARCLVNLEAFPALEQLDILHLAGLQQRKKELDDQPFVNGTWTVLGVSFRQIEQLTERKVYLQLHEKGKIALLLDYAFRSKVFDQTWHTGEVYKAKLKFYPSAVPLRARLEKRKRTTDTCQWKGINDLNKWLNFRKQQLNAHPWLFSYPAVIKEQNLYQKENTWRIGDGQSPHYLQLSSTEDAQLLSAYALGKPFHCFGVWDKGDFQILSLPEDDQIIPLENNIWTH